MFGFIYFIVKLHGVLIQFYSYLLIAQQIMATYESIREDMVALGWTFEINMTNDACAQADLSTSQPMTTMLINTKLSTHL